MVLKTVYTCSLHAPFTENQSQFLFIMFKLCTNKNHSYKHNEQIKNRNIDNSECFGVKFVKIYPEITSQYLFEKIWFYHKYGNTIPISLLHKYTLSI
jgi:protease II